MYRSDVDKMREIKFRAWENNQIRYDFWQRCDLGNYLNSIGVFKDVKIMQFTGLQDKNGKDIYEGDILKNNDYLFEVHYKEAGFFLRNISDNSDWIMINEHPYSEVVGNIYENPKLLK